jgi:Do/DeqQ family serine protease
LFQRVWFKALTLAVYALLFVSLGIYLQRTVGTAPAPPRGEPSPRTGAAAPSPSGPEENPFIRVAELATPSVVNISTVSTRRRGPSPLMKHFSDDPRFRDFFDRFFEGSPDRKSQANSLGTGVIFDTAGHILTNNHVIKDADQITIKLASKQELKARPVGSDPRTDVAVLQVIGQADLPVASFGNSDRLRVGQWAIAIGNPFGLEQSLAVGVISATGRSEIGITALENFIQTDASINPGNSGGPLLNIRGEVIGINTAIVAAGQGIGFAIPINLARKVANDLIRKGRITRGWLGITFQKVTPEVARGFGLEGEGGLVISQVMPKSPAEAAGLKTGDVVLSLNGQAVEDPVQAQGLTGDLEVGREVEIAFRRGKETKTVKVKVGEMPAG